jgi:hypothetical protein
VSSCWIASCNCFATGSLNLCMFATSCVLTLGCTGMGYHLCSFDAGTVRCEFYTQEAPCNNSRVIIVGHACKVRLRNLKAAANQSAFPPSVSSSFKAAAHPACNCRSCSSGRATNRRVSRMSSWCRSLATVPAAGAAAECGGPALWSVLRCLSAACAWLITR